MPRSYRPVTLGSQLASLQRFAHQYFLAQGTDLVARRFGATLLQLDNLPSSSGCLLLVEQGLPGLDALPLLALLHRRTERKLRVVGDQGFWHIPGTSRVLASLGLSSNPPLNPVQALREGQILLAQLGPARVSKSKHDEPTRLEPTLRPALIRLAMRANVPLLPVATRVQFPWPAIPFMKHRCGAALPGSVRHDSPTHRVLHERAFALRFILLKPIPAVGAPHELSDVEHLRRTCLDALVQPGDRSARARRVRATGSAQT